MALASSHKNGVPFKTVGRGAKEVVATSVRLSFISFRRASATVRNDNTPTAYYIASVARQAIGARIETSYGRKKLPGLFVVERQLRLQGRLLCLHWLSLRHIIEVITIKAT
jgi:hypothetical protein